MFKQSYFIEFFIHFIVVYVVLNRFEMIDRQMAFQYAMVKNRAKNKENTGYAKGIDEGERLQESPMFSIIKSKLFMRLL